MSLDSTPSATTSRVWTGTICRHESVQRISQVDAFTDPVPAWHLDLTRTPLDYPITWYPAPTY